MQSYLWSIPAPGAMQHVDVSSLQEVWQQSSSFAQAEFLPRIEFVCYNLPHVPFYEQFSLCIIGRLEICEAGLALIGLQICVFRKENANSQPDSR